MTVFGEWGFSGRTLHNQKSLICQGRNIFFPGAFSGMCHRRWGRWAMEQRVLGTSNQVIKCLSIPFRNLMKTSIFIKSKSLGSTAVRFTKLHPKVGETMTKMQAGEGEAVNSRTWWHLFSTTVEIANSYYPFMWASSSHSGVPEPACTNSREPITHGPSQLHAQ